MDCKEHDRIWDQTVMRGLSHVQQNTDSQRKKMTMMLLKTRTGRRGREQDEENEGKIYSLLSGGLGTERWEWLGKPSDQPKVTGRVHLNLSRDSNSNLNRNLNLALSN